MFPKKQTTIACLGDSLTQGNVSYNWVKELAQELQPKNIVFKNFGNNGHLAYNALQRINAVIKCQPDIVIILLGTNDVSTLRNEVNMQRYIQWFKLPKRPNKEWFVENMEAIIKQLQENTKAKIVLVTLPPLGENLEDRDNQFIKEFNDEIKQIAQKQHLTLLDLNQKMQDYLHKNPPAAPKTVPEDMGTMLKAICSHYFLFQNWDKIAQKNGYTLFTDGVHFSSIGGKMLMDLVKKIIG